MATRPTKVATIEKRQVAPSHEKLSLLVAGVDTCYYSTTLQSRLVWFIQRELHVAAKMFGGVRTSLDRLSTLDSNNEDVMTSGLMKLGHAPPSDDPSPSHVDSFLAREMGQLSVQERAEALNDLHGVARTNTLNKSLDSSNENCSNHDISSVDAGESKILEQLDIELDRLPEKPAYNQALLQNASYVKDVKLRLMMIRATNYQPDGAAQLFERFLAKKLELFTVKKLTKNITIEDLMRDENDRRVLESGLFQVLSSPDMAGRTVFCIFPYSRPEGSPLDSVVSATRISRSVQTHCL